MNTTLRLLLFGLLIPLCGQGQFRTHQYRVTNGLPSDFIKDITEDSLGYIWVATDYGLARLDGSTTATHNPHLRSRFMKKFLTTKKGDILVVGDQDLLSITSKPDTTAFTSLVVGTAAPTDSTIWFPKDLFEDAVGNLWLSEPQAISRYNASGLKRYYFSTGDRTSIFVRSFSLFVSPDNELYAASYPGRLFHFNTQRDEFESIDIKLPASISAVHVHGNTILMGSANGLYAATFTNQGISSPKKVFDAPLISCLLRDQDMLWVGTYTGNLLLLRLLPKGDPLLVQSYDFDVINNMYRSKAGDYWLATDKGAVLLQPSAIQTVGNSRGAYVEAVSRDRATGTMYYSVKEELYKIVENEPSWSTKTIHSQALGYFQGIAANNNKVWAANAFSILYFEQDKLKQQWNFAQRGQFVHDICLDRDNQLWLCQDSNDSVMMITPTHQLKTYYVPIKSGNNIIAVRAGRSGMYAISNNPESYLFFKAAHEPHFRNISLPITLTKNADLGLTDLATQGDSVWLATAQGLMLHTGNAISFFDLGTRYKGHAINVVEVLDQEHLLLGNAFGLFIYNVKTNDYWLYDEHTGLPANTMSPRNLVVDKQNRIWVGTSSGVAYLTNEVQNKISPAPGIRTVYVNGIRSQVKQSLRVPHKAFVSLELIAPIYPQSMALLEWRMGNGGWSPVDNFEISLPALAAGKTQVEIRALKTGWQASPIVSLTILVDKPIWMAPWFISLVILTLLIITLITVGITQYIQRKRQHKLEKLIEERTFELNQRNQELDRFVYSASHDLSAPLRSILGLVNVARMENPTNQQQHYLSLMEQSVHKLQSFINEVVNYSRNSRLPVKTETVHFRPLVESILEDHRFSPGFESIVFHVEDKTDGQATLDVLRLKIILNNLISNAIKFRWPHADRQSVVTISIEKMASGKISLRVADNGRGIDQKHLDKLFDMFYRATTDAPGSGLGLYIVKESVKKMNGEIQVESTVNVGTTFTVILPNSVN